MSEVVHLLPNRAIAADHGALSTRLRELADDIENGSLGEVDRVCIVLETAEDVTHRAYGPPTTRAYLVGLLEYAKNNLIAGK
jgi:hypothetical protein